MLVRSFSTTSSGALRAAAARPSSAADPGARAARIGRLRAARPRRPLGHTSTGQRLAGEYRPRTTAPRLEPCSDDRGQTSYEGSDNNAQRADKRNDNGVRDLNAQRGHSSNALPRSALARSRVVAEPLEPCPSLVKFAVGYTHEPCATKRPEPSRDPMRGLRTGLWASRADARGLPLYRTRGARQRPLSLVGPYGPRPAASNPSRQYRPPTTRPAGAGSHGASLA
jgi:hypothetical protein